MGKLPLTKSFVRNIIELTGMSTLLHIARLYDLQWKTVKNIDKANLLKRQKQFSFKKLRYISIDEIAIRKGHHYMTIISDIFTGQIIYAVKGRKEKELAGFLKRLAKRGKRLKGVAMDMSASYAASVSKYLPHVAIVFDRFHVTKVINNALDEIRKEEWKNCQAQGFNVIKGQRFLLLRNFQDLQLFEKSIVENLLEINRPLAIAHTMKEQFRMFWEQKNYQEGVRFLIMWCLEAKMSGIAALAKAAKTFLKHGRGLLNYFLHKIDNGKAEGINNKIKVLKRQAYGFLDTEYFILKLYNLHKKSHELVG
jgi:transposase